MVIVLDSLELTDGVKQQACWASLTACYNGKDYCLVGVEWFEDCSGCPYFIEG